MGSIGSINPCPTSNVQRNCFCFSRTPTSPRCSWRPGKRKNACSMISALPTAPGTRLRALAQRRRSCFNKWRNHERPSRRQIFGQAATACWRSRGGLSSKKNKGCEICTGHFISEQSAGKKADFRKLGDECNIPAKEYQRFQARSSLVAPARREKRNYSIRDATFASKKACQTKFRMEQWRQCKHERSQTMVLDSMLVTSRATSGKTVSYARAPILHHCPFLDTLADDFLRTPSWSAKPGRLLPMSPRVVRK